MNSNERVALLRLHLAVGHRGDLAIDLLSRFGGAREVFRRRPAELAGIEGMTPRSLERLLAPEGGRLADEELRRSEREGVGLLFRGTSAYPEPLRELPEMPLVLFVRGEWQADDARALGVVGSRRPTPYGLRQARRFAGRLASWGVRVVSGLARGVDVAAQEAALESGGRALAVFGSGLGRVYPPEHRALARRIVSEGRGALLSEFPFETPPRSYHFPRRNRLLSGLSRLLLVVEAGERSGSLITADWALRQGRTVYVVPGRVDQPEGRGTLELLRDGAAPAIDPEDLRSELGLPVSVEGEAAADSRARKPLPGPLGVALDGLFAEEDRWTADRLAGRLGIEPSRLSVEIARLEVQGRLLRAADGAYVLAD